MTRTTAGKAPARRPATGREAHAGGRSRRTVPAAVRERAIRILALLLHHGGILGALHRLRRLLSRHGRVVIVAFHRVGPPGDDPSPTIAPGLFERQVRFLASRGRIVPLEEAVAAIRGGRPPEDDALCLTIDDSCHDHVRHVLPILREIGASATVFLSTGPLDDGLPPGTTGSTGSWSGRTPPDGSARSRRPRPTRASGRRSAPSRRAAPRPAGRPRA